jgi:hypothetical protein
MDVRIDLQPASCQLQECTSWHELAVRETASANHGAHNPPLTPLCRSSRALWHFPPRDPLPPRSLQGHTPGISSIVLGIIGFLCRQHFLLLPRLPTNDRSINLFHAA